VTYRGLGLDFFGMSQDTETLDSGAGYLLGGTPFELLQGAANDTVTILLSGQGDTLKIGESEITYVDSHPEIAAIFASHEQTARILAQTVLATMIERERQKKAGRLSGRSLAEALPDEIISVMRHGGDPSACQTEFEESFASWAELSALKTSITKTGWCEKSLALPWDANGHIVSCKASAICKSGTNAAGQTFFYAAAPPPPSDPRVPAPGSATPAPPPTKSELERDIRTRMQKSGETLAQAQATEAWTELAAYLTSLSEAKLYLTMGLGLPAKATDAAVTSALALRGIAPKEALDWFYACNFDTNCFRQTMNLALGQADDRSRDRIAKAVVIVGAAAAVALYLWRR
jgi:hypothetical protein